MRSNISLFLLSVILIFGCPPFESRDYPYNSDFKNTDWAKNPDKAIEYLVNSYCVPAAEVLCGTSDDCGCQKYPPFVSFEHCKESLIERCKEGASSLKGLFSDGRLEISPSEIEGCIERIKKIGQSCDIPDGKKLDTVCKKMVYDRGNLGEQCTYMICNKGNGLCKDGVCLRLPSESESCEGLCADENICIDGICKKLVSENGECNNDLECDIGLVCKNGSCSILNENPIVCHTSADCLWGYICKNGVCLEAEDRCIAENTCGNREECVLLSEYRCRLPSLENELCSSSDECDDGLYCNKGKCVRAPEREEKCADGIYCGKSLVCNQESLLCDDPPSRGAQCAIGKNGMLICGEDLSCIENICSDIPGIGMKCGADFKCEEGAGCDFKENGSFCDKLRGEGEKCMADHICDREYFCNYSENKCRKRLERESECKYGNECKEGFTCLNNNSGKFVCSPIPDYDESCFDKCKEGLICKNVTSEGVCVPTICGIVR